MIVSCVVDEAVGTLAARRYQMELTGACVAKRLAKWFRVEVLSRHGERRLEASLRECGSVLRRQHQRCWGGGDFERGDFEGNKRVCVENALGGLSLRNFVVAVVFSDRADVPAVMASVCSGAACSHFRG
jgi:hypothetical protein